MTGKIRISDNVHLLSVFGYRGHAAQYPWIK